MNNNKKNNMEYKKLINDLIDELYDYYASENSFCNLIYNHPMFYNKTFSENNLYEPPIPNRLMSKDEFIQNLNNESFEYRWKTALYVLYLHKIK